MHRWIACLAGSPDLTVATEFFQNSYGDFFDEPIDQLSVWREEWNDISEAVASIAAGDVSKTTDLVEEGLFLHTSPSVVQHQRKGLANREGAQQRVDVAIKPNSWAGFSWALLARDLHDGITYTQCESSVLVKTATGVALSACGREIPNKTLTGGAGRKGIRFCSERCRRTVNRYEASLGLKEVAEASRLKIAASLRAAMQPMDDQMKQALQAASKAMNSQISPMRKEVLPNIEKAIKRLQGEDNEKS